MIALRKEIFDLVKKETIYISVLFLLALVIFKIAFYKENVITLFRNVLSIFWLFVLPGYFIMLYWHEKLSFLERTIVGIVIAAGATGILSYYLGIIGLNIKFHVLLLPLLLILLGFIAVIRKKQA